MNKKDQFIQAASTGNLQDVKYFIKQGDDIHAGLDYALKYAARNGHFEVVKYLLENRANIHARNNQALKLSQQNKHYKVVRYLEDCQTTKQYRRIYY